MAEKVSGYAVRELIARYGLRPHPEGGYYREVYRSRQTVNSPAVGDERQAVTHIYFLLTRGQVSRFHRVRHDEVWNFYEGAPILLVTFDGQTGRETMLGPGCGGYVGIVEGGVFQAAESTGEYTLVGCTVAPGFEFDDFEFMADLPEQRKTLEMNAPAFRRFI